MSAQTAAQANEYQAAIGQDICTTYELNEWAAEVDDEAERWEREGRTEMYATLFDGFND